MTSEHIKIFDTTLRDGEQAPGCSMTLREKLRISKALADLNVDIIEAGFPAASPGDFESVKAIADLNAGPVICGLARCNAEDIAAPQFGKEGHPLGGVRRVAIQECRRKARDNQYQGVPD